MESSNRSKEFRFYKNFEGSFIITSDSHIMTSSFI